MKEITSRTNPLIKHIVSLHQAKHRATHQEFIAEGIRVCSTLINAGHIPIHLFATESMLASAQQLADDEKIVLVPDTVMKKISTTVTPSGLLGLFTIQSPPTYDRITEGIVLVHMINPGNMGTLIRTTAAMNKKTVIVIEGVDPWNPKVVQASAGTIGLVTIFQLSWQQLLKNKKTHKLCALVISNGKKSEDIDFKNMLLIVGSEAHGIPPAWIDQCEEKLTLPMPGRVESLNAAVAGSIALYLATMQ